MNTFILILNFVILVYLIYLHRAVLGALDIQIKINEHHTDLVKRWINALRERTEK